MSSVVVGDDAAGSAGTAKSKKPRRMSYIAAPNADSELPESIIVRFVDDCDPRVRRTALQSLVTLDKRGYRLKVEHFPLAQQALLDDDESVRRAALELIAGVCAVYPDVQVLARGQDDEHSAATVRLVDDGFSTICDMLGDLSVAVRTQACVLLGQVEGVGEDFLLQTFDKKVMSHLRSKKTEHELIKEKKRGQKLPTFGVRRGG